MVADEQGDPDPGVRPRTGDHRPRLLALEDARLRQQVSRAQVVHPTVAVIDEDVGRPAGACAGDRRICLPDHELDTRRIAGVVAPRGSRMGDPGDALHVDGYPDLHAADDSRAGHDARSLAATLRQHAVGDGRRGEPVRHPELAQDVRDVERRRPLRDVERGRDLAVGATRGEQAENLDLARCQAELAQLVALGSASGAALGWVVARSR